MSSDNIRPGVRVLIPRSSGKMSKGIVTDRWGDKVKVILDEKGRYGQDLGKIVWAHELKRI